MKYQSILLLFLSAHTILESYDFVYEKKFTHETSNNQSKTQPTQDYWEAEARQSFFYEKKCYLPLYMAGELPQTVCTLIKSFKNSGSTHNYNNSAILEGPPGTGKTFLAKNIALHTGAIFLKKDCSEFQDRHVGETEKKLRNFFVEAKGFINKGHKVILFLDEFDTIASNRETTQYTWENSTINQILALIQEYRQEQNLIIIVATNLYNKLDPAARDRCLHIPIDFPNEKNCEQIFEFYLQDYNSDELKELLKELATIAADKKLSIRKLQDIVYEAIQHAERTNSLKVSEDTFKKYFYKKIENTRTKAK